MRRPLRIGLDARMGEGVLGGVQQVVIGIAAGLGRLDDGDEEYLFLTTPGADDWLRPHLRGSCRAMTAGSPPWWAGKRQAARAVVSRRISAVAPPLMPRPSEVDVMGSDGTIERAGVDVMHFLCQMAFLTDVPSIYQPHDLQHLRLPELFSPRDIELRERWYRAFCAQASLVAVMTRWGKHDLIDAYGLSDEKVAVVPWGVVIDAYPEPSDADLLRVRDELDLPERFLLFPAQTWPHKNHLGLLQALSQIRETHGTPPPLVCCGHRYEQEPELERVADELGLSAHVRFLGFVSPLELRCLYQLASALVFPSRFEGWGMPVTEAFQAGLAVACSDATVLPEVAGDAALLFDPDDPREIAAAVWRLWSDEQLRHDLAERGRRRAGRLSFDRAARVFRAHYRRIAGRPLSSDDRELIRSSLEGGS